MEVVRNLDELWLARASLRGPAGFVPTMGALHAGHESLIARARDDCRTVAVSIFVNPLQFGPAEDFAQYPRPFEDDLQLLSRHGVDLVFAPSVDDMYPGPLQCTVALGSLATVLEGARRPGHFNGVATVVLKLFHLISPDRAYFGQKDAQQLAVVARLIKDFNLPIELVSCPIVRGADDLALSSRNTYLSPDQRREATRLYRALTDVAQRLQAGAKDITAVIREATGILPPLKIDYVAVVDPDVFEPLAVVPEGLHRLLAVGAAFAGPTRLIDNLEVRVPAVSTVVGRAKPDPEVGRAGLAQPHPIQP